MNIRNYIIAILPTTVMLTSCSNSEGPKTKNKVNNQTQINADSVKITALVRSIYEWHETKYQNHSFPLKFNSPPDSLFIGIDWKAYNKDYETFKRTNFFSDDFLARHREIAMAIDSSVKQASPKWRNINNGIPLWNTDTDDWCGCQDSPDNYWKQLTVSNFKFNNETVMFNWIWDNKDGIDPPFKYEMKAKKVNGTWKISYMNGFKHYGTVADYKKMMNHDEQQSRR